MPSPSESPSATAARKRRPRWPSQIPQDILTMMQATRTVPDLPPINVRVVNVTADGDTASVVNEIEAESMRAVDVGGVMVIDPIRYDGQNHTHASLEAIGMFRCSTCGNVLHVSVRHEDTRKCRTCHFNFLPDFLCKSTPNGGWKPIRNGDGDTSPLFGFEIEFEAPRDKLPHTLARGVCSELGWGPPAYMCGDGSLRNGKEIDTNPLSRDWIIAQSDKLAAWLAAMRAAGARDTDGDGQERAGVHVHFNEDWIGGYESNMYRWLNGHATFVTLLSCRGQDRFEHWSGITPRASRKYIEKKAHGTYECRGFSAKVLLEARATMLDLTWWVQAVAFVSRQSDIVAVGAMSIKDALAAVGAPEAVATRLSWFGDVDRPAFDGMAIARREKIDKAFTDLVRWENYYRSHPAMAEDGTLGRIGATNCDVNGQTRGLPSVRVIVNRNVDQMTSGLSVFNASVGGRVTDYPGRPIDEILSDPSILQAYTTALSTGVYTCA